MKAVFKLVLGNGRHVHLCMCEHLIDSFGSNVSIKSSCWWSLWEALTCIVYVMRMKWKNVHASTLSCRNLRRPRQSRTMAAFGRQRLLVLSKGHCPQNFLPSPQSKTSHPLNWIQHSFFWTALGSLRSILSSWIYLFKAFPVSGMM